MDDYPEPDDEYDEEHEKVYSEYEISGFPDDEVVEVYWSTNDNLDKGFPTEYADYNHIFRAIGDKSAFKRALEYAKYWTDKTWGGGERRVYLNGDKLDHELWNQLMEDN